MLNRNLRYFISLVCFIGFLYLNQLVEEKNRIYVFLTFFSIMLGFTFFYFKELKKVDKINDTNVFAKTVKERAIYMSVIALMLFLYFYFAKAEPLPLP